MNTFLSEALFIFPSKCREFLMQTNLTTVFRQMGKSIAFKYYLKGGLCKILVVSLRLKP